MDDLKRASPTLFISVPRLWSLFQKNTIEKVGANKLNFYYQSLSIYCCEENTGRNGIKLGTACWLRSAPIAPSILNWYLKIGVQICEAWGMTENCAYAIINHPFRIDKISSVGHPAGCEIKVEDDELLFRSRLNDGVLQAARSNFSMF